MIVLTELGVKQEKQTLSFLGKVDENRKNAISACLKLVQMWADVTMVYQGEFPELWECYRKLRLVKSRDRMFNCHNFDQVRLI